MVKWAEAKKDEPVEVKPRRVVQVRTPPSDESIIVDQAAKIERLQRQIREMPSMEFSDLEKSMLKMILKSYVKQYRLKSPDRVEQAKIIFEKIGIIFSE
jgi:recombinational DNA repair protein (RecF pathway)